MTEQKYQNMVIYYDRNQSGDYTGVTIVAIHEKDMRHVGISLCNYDAGDRFNKKKGRAIAVGRAMYQQKFFHGQVKSRPSTSLLMTTIFSDQELENAKEDKDVLVVQGVGVPAFVLQNRSRGK